MRPNILRRFHSPLIRIGFAVCTLAALLAFLPARGFAATGGPDTFGYTFFDSSSGCSFDFVDISETGIQVLSSGATTPGAVTLQETFDLYGVTVSTLYMDDDGYITTESTDPGVDTSNDCPLPQSVSSGGGARIYPLHDALSLAVSNGAGGYEQYFPVCPRPNDRCPASDSCTVFQWDNASHTGNDAQSFTFQAILYHQTNDIVFQVLPGNPENGSGSTTGLQNLGATDGLTYACNTANSIVAPMAMCIQHPNSAPAICSASACCAPNNSCSILTASDCLSGGETPVANLTCADNDGDGAEVCEDSDDTDRYKCSDLDNDLCDDCSTGEFSTNFDGHDLDGDGLCDLGDPESDDDGVPFPGDNCPLVNNPDQADADQDGTGDACEGCEKQELLADDGATPDEFGNAVAIYENLAVVGAWKENGTRGAAYVFRKINGEWTQTAKLQSSTPGIGDAFGFSVSVWSDLILVGVPGDDDIAGDAGAAYVFGAINDFDWAVQEILYAPDASSGDQFGTSVGIWDRQAVVGAPHDDDDGTSSGAAWIFKRDNSDWIQELGAAANLRPTKLSPGDLSAGDEYGHSVSMTTDYAAVGSPAHDLPVSGGGAVYLWNSSVNAIPSLNEKVTAHDVAPGDAFGTSVFLYQYLMVVGSPGQDTLGLLNAGAAYVYGVGIGPLQFRDKLFSPEASNQDAFGTSVGISPVNGDICVIAGIPGDDDLGSNSGSAWVFQQDGNFYPPFREINAADGAANDGFGSSVAIYDTGIVVGAPKHDHLGADAGSAHTFELADSDNDGIVNSCDNCPTVSNPDQLDSNGDGTGDACEDCQGAQDLDGDGHLAPPCGGDCNDNDPSVNPGVLENCLSPVDDNCDDLINCADPDCAFDNDGDGQPPAPCGIDCDDTDPDNFVGNTESCIDGSDNNCDGFADCEDLSCNLQPCDDGVDCTTGDSCNGFICTSTPDDTQCDDGFSCTQDWCDAVNGCQANPQDAVCDNGLFCDGTEVCIPAAQDADADGCSAGNPPCGDVRECDEELDLCESCTPDIFEPDDLCGSARDVTVSTTLQGEEHTLCPLDDVDRIRFSVTEGAQYRLFTTGDAVDTLGILSDQSCGVELARNNDCSVGDANFCITWTATFTGTVVLNVLAGPADLEPEQEVTKVDRPDFYARLARTEEASGLIGPYSLWFQQTQPTCTPDVFEPIDNDCQGATSITPGDITQIQDHSICGPGDIDRFRFLGEAGVPYRFFTTGDTDTKFEIRSDDCQTLLQVISDCNGDPNACVTVTPPATAFYTINVLGQTGDVRGDYRFHFRRDDGTDCTVDTGEPDDPCASATNLIVTEAPQTVGRSICGEGDIDSFSFLGEAGQTYTLRTFGQTDVVGLVQSGDCQITLAESANCGGDSDNFCIAFTPVVTSLYKLRVRGRTEAVTGDYVLEYKRTDECVDDPFEPDGRCDQATEIVPTITAQRQGHTICPSDDIDLFRFFGVGGQTYRFASEGPTDMGGAVLDSSCQLFLLKNETCDGTDENFCLTWTAPETGIYTLGTTSSSGGSYDLVFQQLADPGAPCEPDANEPDNVCVQATIITPVPTQQDIDLSLCPTDDRDHFVFQGEAGKTYRFWSSGGVDTIGVIRDTVTCSQIKRNDDCNLPDDLNFCLTWTAPSDDLFVLEVKPFSRQHDFGDYTLSFETVE